MPFLIENKDMELRKYLLNNFTDYSTSDSGPKSIAGTIVIYFQNNKIWVIDTVNVAKAQRIFYKRIMSDIPKTLKPYVKQYPGFRIFISYEKLKGYIKEHYKEHILKKTFIKKADHGVCLKITHIPTGHYYLSRHTNPKVNEIAILRDTLYRWRDLDKNPDKSHLHKFVNTHIHDILKGTNFTIRNLGGFINEDNYKQLVEDTLTIYGPDKNIRDEFNESRN